MIPSIVRLRSLASPWIALCAFSMTSATCLAEVRQEIPSENEDKFATVHDRAAQDYMDGQYERALEGFTAAINLNPTSSKAYYNRGTAYFAKREYELAIKDFDEAIRLDPSLVYAFMNRGSAFSNLGRLDEALRDLDLAAKLNPKIGDIYFNRAIVNIRRRDTTRALADYEAAIKLDDDRDEALAIRKRLMKLIGRGVPKDAPDGIIVSATNLVGVDPIRMTSEIEHGRRVEHILRLINDSCISNGDDIEGLANLALARKWDSVSAEVLSKNSSSMAKLTGGWTISDRFGTYAIIQSVVPEDRNAYACSITTGLGSTHLMEDLKTSFESRFGTDPSEIVDRPGQTLTRYWISRAGKEEAKVSLVMNGSSSSITVRIMMGKASVKEGKR